MTKAKRLAPWTVYVAIRMQFFQTFLLLVFSAFGLFLAIEGPERGMTHKQRVLETIVRILLPGLVALCTAVLLVAGNTFGWWLAVGWNLVAIAGTVAAFLPYLREGAWVLPLILLVAPTLAIGCLFTHATRRYFALLRLIQAAPH